MRMMVMGVTMVLGGGLLAGCPEDAETETETVTETAPIPDEPAPPQPQDDSEAGPVVDEANFELRAEAGGPYATGEAGTFAVSLVPKSGWHVNEEYPMQIEIEAPEGIDVPQTSLGRDAAAEFAEERARFDVGFTPSAAGEHRVVAKVDFAVCTPQNCVPDQRTLALVLPVQ